MLQADRYEIGDKLKDYSFDLVIDHAYSSQEVELLLDALGTYKDYVLISSSAVYPEYEMQSFVEEGKTGKNKFWGQYGADKIEAENVLLRRKPDAYILRLPYLYGPMNNVYREAFVFEGAMNDRKYLMWGIKIIQMKL